MPMAVPNVNLPPAAVKPVGNTAAFISRTGGVTPPLRFLLLNVLAMLRYFFGFLNQRIF